MMTKSFDVCISGDGIVGMTAALLLAQHQYAVALVGASAQHSPSRPDVRAYALSHRSRTLLEKVACWPSGAAVQGVNRMQVRGDASGRVDFDGVHPEDVLNWIVDVSSLETLLKQALTFQPRVTRFFDDGSLARPDAPLVIISEGRCSPEAKMQGLTWQARKYQQWALATRVSTKQPIGHDHYTAHQWFHDGSIVGLLPLASSDDAPSSMEQAAHWALVWSLPPNLAQSRQHGDKKIFCELLEQSTHGEMGAFEVMAERAVWPLQHGMAPHWFKEKAGKTWMLMGDSAHNVHPLAGQGLNLGLGDVATWMRLLTEKPSWRSITDVRLLRCYERERKADFALVGGVGDKLQRLFSARSAVVMALRNYGMFVFNKSSLIKSCVLQQAKGV